MEFVYGEKVRYIGTDNDGTKHDCVYTFNRYNRYNIQMGYIMVGDIPEYAINIRDIVKLTNKFHCKSNCKDCKGKCGLWEEVE